MLEQDYDFDCPHCSGGNSVKLDVSGGSKQSFIQDCEVCCKPFQITVQFENGALIDFSADPQD